MNTKRIEFVAQAYERDGDGAAREAIALFRPLWAVQARAAEEASAALAASGWQPPAAEELARAYWEGTPFLAQAPVPIDAARYTACARSLAEALAAAGRPELAGHDWEALVASAPLELAGRDPAAYLDACLAAGEGAGGGEPDAAGTDGTAALVLALALRPQLEPAALACLDAVRPYLAHHPEQSQKPRACPVCGSEPALAHVGPTEQAKANVRTLCCTQCGATWEFERVRCARCGTHNQELLHYTSIEGDDVHRLHTCDACHGYLRTHFALDNDLRPFSPEVEDAVMARLDAVASTLGLSIEAQG